jgi:hypothetical protein
MDQRQRLPLLFFGSECKIVAVALAGIYWTDMHRVRIELRNEVDEDVKAVALFQFDQPLQRYSSVWQCLVRYLLMFLTKIAGKY